MILILYIGALVLFGLKGLAVVALIHIVIKVSQRQEEATKASKKHNYYIR